MGYGQEYRYAHDEPGLPTPLEKSICRLKWAETYYFPTKRGLETKIGEEARLSSGFGRESPQKRYEK
ncbi:hypothetical protein O9929_19165 [Vibrio lentus]|nr:hypothetical protein [Vibrio lentus]